MCIIQVTWSCVSQRSAGHDHHKGHWVICITQVTWSCVSYRSAGHALHKGHLVMCITQVTWSCVSHRSAGHALHKGHLAMPVVLLQNHSGDDSVALCIQPPSSFHLLGFCSQQQQQQWGVGMAQWLERRPGFESRQERRENFLFQSQLSVLTLISVSVPPRCYRSST